MCLVYISKPTALIHTYIINDCFVFLAHNCVKGVQNCVKSVRNCVKGVRNCVKGVQNCVKGVQNYWYLLLLKLYKINVDKTKYLN